MLMREPNGMIGKHITAMCPACRDQLQHEPTTHRLESIYAEDCEQWIANAIRAATPQHDAEHMGDTLALRIPLGVEV
jgi:hypothetical protein